MIIILNKYKYIGNCLTEISYLYVRQIIVYVTRRQNDYNILYDLRSKNTLTAQIIYLISKTITGKLILLFMLTFVFQHFIYDILTSYLYMNNWNNIFTISIRNINYVNIFVNIFAHGSIIHLFINSIILLSFGIIIEDFIKTNTYISLFIIGGIVSSISQMYIGMLTNNIEIISLYPNETMILGASGAILSVIGASAIRKPDSKIKIILFPFVEFNILTALILFILCSILIIIIFGVGAFNISHTSHITGILFGFWFGYNRFGTQSVQNFLNDLKN